MKKNLFSNVKVLMCTLLFSALFFVSTFAMAQDAVAFPEPSGDVTALLLKLATDYKTLGLFGILSVVIVLSVQAIKAWVNPQWKYKRLLTLIMSVIYSVISGLVVPGASAVSVIVTVFVSSGGAIALYEGLKGAGVIKSNKV